MWPFDKKTQTLPPAPAVKLRRRGYDAAKTNRLTGDFRTFEGLSNDILGTVLPTLRNRSRNLARNNGYMKGFLRVMRVNVLGRDGIRLRSTALTPQGKPDQSARDAVEAAWEEWGNTYADFRRRLTWRGLCRLWLRRIILDGAAPVRIVRGEPDNPFRFALQTIGDEYLADANRKLSNGSQIINGVEVDGGGRILGYWIYQSNPNASLGIRYGNRVKRIPADEFYYMWQMEDDEPEAVRGTPWAAAEILDLQMIGKLMEAETIRARVEASKMGFITADPEYFGGDGLDGQGEDDDGSTIEEVSPGLVVKLQPGQDFKTFDPSGKSDLPPFIKAILRKISSGLGISYNSLARDLEGVNFGSLRGGYLEDQENFIMLQDWFSELVHRRVFGDWLDMALLAGKIGPYGIADRERLAHAEWIGRRWSWVDPLKDAAAAKTWIEIGVASRAEMIRQRGRDIEDVDEEIAADNFIQQSKPESQDDSSNGDEKNGNQGTISQAATG